MPTLTSDLKQKPVQVTDIMKIIIISITTSITLIIISTITITTININIIINILLILLILLLCVMILMWANFPVEHYTYFELFCCSLSATSLSLSPTSVVYVWHWVATVVRGDRWSLALQNYKLEHPPDLKHLKDITTANVHADTPLCRCVFMLWK